VKTAKDWQDQLAGETSVQSIQCIQMDAMVQAAETAKNALYEAGRQGAGRMAFRAILDSATDMINSSTP
jgi:hypothetical protein